MNEKEATKWLLSFSKMYGDGIPEARQACEYAINAIVNQIRTKEYIERINHPEYQDIKWSKQELVLLLQELVVDGSNY